MSSNRTQTALDRLACGLQTLIGNEGEQATCQATAVVTGECAIKGAWLANNANPASDLDASHIKAINDMAFMRLAVYPPSPKGALVRPSNIMRDYAHRSGHSKAQTTGQRAQPGVRFAA